ncbi:MAG TPA: MATE family efflux transporter, partial [Propionibacteriaceae bacterium]|nr:MATE family efflux transporter [Propionibacteriaceae bacterium]
MTSGSPLRVIIWFTIPLLVGNLFQQLYVITDAAVVGRLLGVDALASVGASGSLQFLLIGFGLGASAGVAIPVAKAFGAGDLPAMRRAVT